MFGFRFWNNGNQDQTVNEPPIIEELAENEDADHLRRSSRAVVEEPDDEGGFHSPQYVGRQRSQPFSWFRFGRSFDEPTFEEPSSHRPVSDDPFSNDKWFRDPFSWTRGLFSGWFSSPWRHWPASNPVPPPPDMPTSQPTARPPADGSDYSYICRTSTGGIGEPSVVHTVSASGNASDGYRMREEVWDARTGETTVVREEKTQPGTDRDTGRENGASVPAIEIK